MTRARDVANLIGSGNFSSTTFTATAGQTAFTISHTQGFIQVFMNGLLLDETADYTSNGSAVTLTSGAAAGDEIEVVKYNTFSVGDAIPASGGTFTGNVGFGAAPTRQVHIAGNPSIMLMEDTGGGTNDKKAQLQVDSGVFEVNSRNDDNSSLKDNILTAQLDTGNIGIGELNPQAPLEVNGIAMMDSARLTSNSGTSYWDIRRDSTTGHFMIKDDGQGDVLQINQSTAVLTHDGNNNHSGGGAVSGNNASSKQHVAIGGTGYIIVNRFAQTPMYLNRMSDDGVIVNFYAHGNLEGNISVSGSTVSYNGGHLSRWSQLVDNTKDTSIVKGTVMTNLDKMAVWTHAAKKVGDDILDVSGNVIDQETEAQAARTEINEQLNCMAVSSVEGDPNVAGVFVNWDEDDDVFTNDMNVAMTGDMVIRIAKGVTIARGDLLMSAGDGTAKPQDDDIVRSKTIAKVTSTNVSHTYDDGSYLVPCVLMAC